MSVFNCRRERAGWDVRAWLRDQLWEDSAACVRGQCSYLVVETTTYYVSNEYKFLAVRANRNRNWWVKAMVESSSWIPTEQQLGKPQSLFIMAFRLIRLCSVTILIPEGESVKAFVYFTQSLNQGQLYYWTHETLQFRLRFARTARNLYSLLT